MDMDSAEAGRTDAARTLSPPAGKTTCLAQLAQLSAVRARVRACARARANVQRSRCGAAARGAGRETHKARAVERLEGLARARGEAAPPRGRALRARGSARDERVQRVQRGGRGRGAPRALARRFAARARHVELERRHSAHRAAPRRPPAPRRYRASRAVRGAVGRVLETGVRARTSGPAHRFTSAAIRASPAWFSRARLCADRPPSDTRGAWLQRRRGLGRHRRPIIVIRISSATSAGRGARTAAWPSAAPSRSCSRCAPARSSAASSSACSDRCSDAPSLGLLPRRRGGAAACVTRRSVRRMPGLPGGRACGGPRATKLVNAPLELRTRQACRVQTRLPPTPRQRTAGLESMLETRSLLAKCRFSFLVFPLEMSGTARGVRVGAPRDLHHCAVLQGLFQPRR